MFTRSDQLLSEEPTETSGGLDRPHAVTVEGLGPRQQAIGLMPVGAQGQSCELTFIAVDGNSGVRRFVGIDSDRDGHEVLRSQRVDRRGGHS
jgi:hypothetical protein